MFCFHTRGIASRGFVYSDAISFHSLRKKTSERVDAAGDRCMAITVIQYFIVIER